MSVFSELLRSHIEKCGITIVSLAKQSGVERTTLHKIISGERKPPNVEFVIKLSGLLMLSSAERERLIEQYEIPLVGDELYRRRRNVMEMIRKLSALGSESRYEPSEYFRIRPAEHKDHELFYSKRELQRAVYSLFVSEFEKGNDIDIIAQPTEDFCLFMKYLCVSYKGSRIRHIFCLDSGYGSDESNDYNLGLFPGVCELSYNFSGYESMYYYDCVDSHINKAVLLPVVLLGKTFVVCADADLETGMLLYMPDAVSFYAQKFRERLKMCYTFVERANNVAGMVGSGSSYHDYILTLDDQPSLMLVSEEDEIRTGLKLPPDRIDFFVEKVRFLKKRYYKKEYMVIFSGDGLGNFMNTGIVKELPGGICTPVSYEVRIKTLRNMIEKTEQGIYDFRIIEDSSSPSDKLRINLDTEGAVHFVLRSRGDYVFMTVGEQSVRLAVHDYFTHLIESGKIYNREHSLDIMRDMLSVAIAKVDEQNVNN